MKDKLSSSGTGIQALARPVGFGLIFGVCFILVMLVLVALILSFGIISLDISPVAASFSIAVGSFFGGLFAAKKHGKNGMLIGSLCGGLMFLVFTLISLIATKQAPSTATLIRLVIFVTAAAIGGVFGVGTSNKRKIV